MSYLLGIDAGTTAFKAVLFDQAGRALGQASEEILLSTPVPDWVEVEPERYWSACCRCIQGALHQSAVDPHQIAALAISSQGETLVVLDEQSLPLRPAVVWLDNRSKAEACELAARFGEELAFHTTGQPQIVPTWPASKMMWLRRHEPEVFRRVGCFLLLEDYLLFRLTGRLVADPCLWTSSLLLDIGSRSWWPEMLDAVGVEPEHLPELVDSGRAVGQLTQAAAREAGLWPGTIAATGGLDQPVAALGAGNTRPGIITENTGGALAIVATTTAAVFDPQRRIPCHVHAVPDAYCLLPWCQTAGMALRWFRDVFGAEELAAAARGGGDAYDLLTAAAAAVPAGSEGLVALPHLAGAACPEFDPAARGVFFGMGLHHTRGHFVRALLEAVAYMLRRNVEVLVELGVTVEEIRSLGGGARSAVWNQIKADVLGRPVLTLDTQEAACLGAAILAGAAVGLYPSAGEAAQQMASVCGRWEPNQANKAIYDQGFRAYVELYERLEGLFAAAAG
jgi:xylulokinase